MAEPKEPISAADFMAIQLAGAQKKFGRENCYMAKDHWVRQFGVPLPSLALQYMFCVENLPFGRFYGFSGPTQSFKSSICFWLLRNIMSYGGLGLLVETERKVSDTLMEGIIGKYLNAMQQYNATSLEQGQDMITYALDFYKKTAVQRHLPYGICWDSLRGVLSEATSDKISKEGHYSKSYSAEAHALSPYFAKMVEELSFWPMLLFFVQHEKNKQQEGYGGGGGQAKSTLGGEAPRFHSTVLTRSRVVKSPIEGALNPYADVDFKTVKNNLGILGRRCAATIHFHQRFDEAMGMNVHNYFFDWAKADCDCLTSDKLENKAGVKEVINLEEHSSNKGYYRCKELGFDKATAQEVYDILRTPENKKTFEALKRAMRITKNLRFDQVEWTQVDGTDKKPIMDWAVKAGTDLTGIQSISEEENEAANEEAANDGSADQS